MHVRTAGRAVALHDDLPAKHRVAQKITSGEMHVQRQLQSDECETALARKIKHAPRAVGNGLEHFARTSRIEGGAGGDLDAEATVVSPFVAFKAWSARPEPISLLSCKRCVFRFYSRALSEVEVRAFYDDYWDESYF